MIRLLNKIPKDITIAVSGGIDSMAALDFLNNSRRNVSAAYFDHGTEYSLGALELVEKYCYDNGINFISQKIPTLDHGARSKEEFWRSHRYDFLSIIPGHVITAHHLNDVVEWWVFSSLHGQSRLIPYSRDNVIRPFLLTPKESLEQWVEKNDVPYVSDPSNQELTFRRNFIRHKMMPDVLDINPGIETLLRKKLVKAFTKENTGKNVQARKG